jgi:hypothetical protein
MATYKVSRQITQAVLVEAESEREALDKAQEVNLRGGRKSNGFKNLMEWQEEDWSNWKAEESPGWKGVMDQMRGK